MKGPCVRCNREITFEKPVGFYIIYCSECYTKYAEQDLIEITKRDLFNNMKYNEQVQRELLKELFDGEEFNSLLDVGCGNAYFASLINGSVKGFDNDPEVIRIAQQYPGKYSIHDATITPWPYNEKFDIVLSKATLILIDPKHDEAILEEIKRLGKRLILLEFNGEPRTMDIENGRIRVIRDYKTLLEKHGFRDIELKESKVWPGQSYPKGLGYIIKANI